MTAAAVESPSPARCRPETTGTRPTAFSRWHREQLSGRCLATDVDLLEVRANKGIVAVLEVAEVEEGPTIARARAIAAFKSIQLAAVKQIADALKVPPFFILHDRACTVFVVADLAKRLARVMGESSFKAFLESL